MAPRKIIKKSQPKQQETPVVETPVVQKTEPIQEPVVETKETTETENITVSVEERIKSMMGEMDEHMKKLKTMKTDLKSLLSSYQKEVKLNKNKKKRNNGKQYTPHGFTKPVNVSKELAKFLNIPEDGLVARPSVTSAISKYIKAHNLANPEDGSIFKTDAVLKSLLGDAKHLVKPKKPELGVGFSYMNLQTYLAPHFVKA